MIDIHVLPIPDWGLHCPGCGAELAGMRGHRCEKCGRFFSILQLLGIKRPIPHLGLTCEVCGYLLTGLMEERCPECGASFSIREMLDEQSDFDGPPPEDASEPADHHLQKREPAFTGRERPLPDFRLACSHCGSPLVGAAGNRCPECGEGFDLAAIVPDGGEWVSIAGFVPFSLSALTKAILYDAQIPYLMDFTHVAGFHGEGWTPGRLRVPRDFFFDALHALAAARQAPPAYAQTPWTCPSCGENVPGGFEVCWNCNAPHPDTPREQRTA